MTKKSDEILPEITPETTTKKAPEITPETTAKKAPEITPEITSEKAPEITSEVAPEITLEKAPAIDLSATIEKKIKKEADSLVFGVDPFQKIFSQKSKTADHTESVHAMQIDRAGCLVKTSVFSRDSLVETTTFVPGVRVQDIRENGVIVGRKLVHI